MLTVKNLTIAPLLHEVNFRVPAGEIVTLMGPSGSGKDNPGTDYRQQAGNPFLYT